MATLQVHQLDSLAKWEGAARVVLKAAEAGKDLGPFLAVIRQAYLESHQLPVMEPLAQAVARHYLNSHDLAGLCRLLQDPEFRPYLVKGLLPYASRLSLEELSQLLQAPGPWHALISRYCLLHPELLSQIFESISARPETRKILPTLLQDMVIAGLNKRLDMSQSVAWLAACENRPQALATMRWLVEADVDLGDASFLWEGLTAPDPEVQRLSAYCLSYQQGLRGSWSALDPCLQHQVVQVRLGATQALCVLLNSKAVDDSQLVQRLLDRLFDPDEALRRFARQGLAAGQRQGRKVHLDSVGGLARQLSESDHQDEVCQYLYWWMHGSASKAAQVQALLQTAARRGATLSRLLATCEEAAAGQHPWACTICQFIPRQVHCTAAYDLPKNLDRLLPQQSYEVSGSRHCPECQARYRVSYSEEYEDMCPNIEIEVVRLADPRANPQMLEHFQDYLRQDTAYALSQQALQARDWSALNGWIGHIDPLVREQALLALSTSSVPRTPLLECLRARLDDPERSARQLAAQILLRYWVDNKETAPLEQILRQAPVDVRGWAILAIVHSEGLDPVPLARPLQELCNHSDQELRSRAVQGVAWLGQRGYQSDSELKLLRGLLGHPEVETRQRALQGLESLVKEWGPQSDEIVAEVRQLLQSDRATRYYSLALLRSVATQAAIQSCFPALIELLLHDREGYADDAGVILQQAIGAGHMQPFLVEAMAPGWALQGEQERYLVSQCYQAMARAGLDLQPALPQMMAALTGPRSCYVESYFAADLTGFLTRSARLEPEAVSQLERLLEANADVSGCVAQALAARAKQGLDLTPLLPSLVKMLGDRHWFAGDGARQALLAQARLLGSPAVLQAVAGALPSQATLQLRKELEGP